MYVSIRADRRNLGDIIAIGGTSYSGANQFALWGLAPGGTSATNFGVYEGLGVPDVNATAASGAIDGVDGGAADGFVYIAGTKTNSSNDLFLGRTDATGTLDTGYGTVVSGSGQGYFTQDLGTASTDSTDVVRAMTAEDDGTAIIVGNTSGNNVAVARYFDTGSINVVSGSEGRPMLSLSAVQAAATSATPFSAAPAISPDAAATGTDDALARRRRASVHRAALAPPSAPAQPSASLVPSPSA